MAKTVERAMTDRERALAVLLEIAEDPIVGPDAMVRVRAAEIVLARENPNRRPSLMQNYAQQQAG